MSTVLFVDVSGFTGLAARLDPEDVHALIRPWASVPEEPERVAFIQTNQAVTYLAKGDLHGAADVLEEAHQASRRSRSASTPPPSSGC